MTKDSFVASLLRQLVAGGVVPADGWEAVGPADRDALAELPDPAALADALAARRLLTPFQAGRVRAGSAAGLVLGNYRLLDKIGAGGMGVVFRAEHRRFRTPAAVKALLVDGRKNRRAVDRFFLEVRAVTGLRHPHVVAAVDAGEEPGAGPDGQPVPYLVMEYVAGPNLDDLVARDGPLPVARACRIGREVADALTEAHRHGLVHRDIKPSNVLLTGDGQAKLADFGVARLPDPDCRLTADGARLGTVGFMAPEQARDARGVDARADVFGLAATVFYALTGADPFVPPGGAAAAARPPSAAAFRPDVPAALDAALARMMALDPAARTPSAAAAARDLTAFVGWADGDSGTRTGTIPAVAPAAAGPADPPAHRVLIVDDEPAVRRVCRLSFESDRVACDEAATGPDAVAKARAVPYDLILLDVDLPGLSGDEVLRRVRERPPGPNTKVVMLSGRATGDDLSRLMPVGADDFLVKPFSVVQLRGRVAAALKLKDAQDRTDRLTASLAAANADLERALTARDAELVHARGALVLALARLVGERSTETGGHLIRLQRYCRALAAAAADTPAFAARLAPDFVEAVEAAAPLHDIGKVAVPDAVLNKPGPLTADERRVMQAHTTVGADTLAAVAAQYPFATSFFQVAVDIARHHHERWDGTGYPDRMAGEAIPLAARLVAVADVYDALRARRAYKPPISHPEAVALMLDRSPGHFDPALVGVFRRIDGEFDRVFREMAD